MLQLPAAEVGAIEVSTSALTSENKAATKTFPSETMTPRLHTAAGKGDHEGVAALLASGKDVNEQDQYGYTALQYADPESPETIAELLAAGARTDIEDHFGGTPMDSLREKFSDYQIAALFKMGRQLASKRLAIRIEAALRGDGRPNSENTPPAPL